MRFLLTIVLLVAVVMVAVDAHSRARHRRYSRNHRIVRKPSVVFQNKRTWLKNIPCHSVKRSGLCERCCEKNHVFHHKRRYLKNLKCSILKTSGLCNRCCDPCYKVECCAPLTCAGGVCKCNGNVCKKDQICIGTGVDACCVDNPVASTTKTTPLTSVPTPPTTVPTSPTDTGTSPTVAGTTTGSPTAAGPPPSVPGISPTVAGNTTGSPTAAGPPPTPAT